MFGLFSVLNREYFWRDDREAEGARLLSECRGLNPYRGFESLSLRSPLDALPRIIIDGAEFLL
jgi:hypothetical protein